MNKRCYIRDRQCLTLKDLNWYFAQFICKESIEDKSVKKDVYVSVNMVNTEGDKYNNCNVK